MLTGQSPAGAGFLRVYKPSAGSYFMLAFMSFFMSMERTTNIRETDFIIILKEMLAGLK